MPDFYDRVPKGWKENLEYRRDLLARCAKDEGLRAAVDEACKHDFLFFCNALCWLYEPRDRFFENGTMKPKTIPFITWNDQDVYLTELRKYLGTEDILVEKRRGCGMSWAATLLSLHDWKYKDGAKIGMVTRNENLADDPNNSDSLFWKIDWELKMLPPWWSGKKNTHWTRNVTKHSLDNKRNGAQINADAATGNVFRGGRLTYAVMDEFAFFNPGEDEEALAASGGATDSRLFISTVDTEHCAFHRLSKDPLLRKIFIDWRDNADCARGLYRYEHGKCIPLDDKLPENYAEENREVFAYLEKKGFKLEGTIRSPWYDSVCARADATPQSIAREQDRNPKGTSQKVFGVDFFTEAEKSCMPHFKEGEFYFDPETLQDGRFVEKEGGPLKLWMKLAQGDPPRRKYVLGCDSATGRGGAYCSNSTIIGLDQTTGEQCLEWADNNTVPYDQADLAIALAKWLYGAYLGWEHAGPGTDFTERVKYRQYGNVYMREVSAKKNKTKTKLMGWVPQHKKRTAFSKAEQDVIRGKFKIRSAALKEECGEYEYDDKGDIVHRGARATSGADAGQAHGDRVVGFAVAAVASEDRPVDRSKPPETTQSAPFGSIAHRRAMERAEKKPYQLQTLVEKMIQCQ